MSKAVLIARPHTFIVTAMKPFLEEGGFGTDKLERIAKQAGIQATITGLDPTPVVAAQLGRPETFLYLSKNDLTSPERRATSARLIQRHFR